VAQIGFVHRNALFLSGQPLKSIFQRQSEQFWGDHVSLPNSSSRLDLFNAHVIVDFDFKGGLSVFYEIQIPGINSRQVHCLQNRSSLD